MLYLLICTFFRMNENVTHVSLGLHPTTMAFCFSNKPFHDRFIRPEYPLKPLKNPDIPLLESYGKDPGAEFWNQFPSAPIPQHISTPIDVSALKALFKQVHNIYIFPYKKRASNRCLIILNKYFSSVF